MATHAAARLVPLAVSLLLCRAQQQGAAAAEEPDSCAADGTGCRVADHAAHDAPSMLQSRVSSRSNLTSNATGTCLDEQQLCGYNGDPWCAENPNAKCCCGSMYCAPEQGNVGQKDGIISMICYSPNTCIIATPDPSESICGTKGQQQVPCCAGSTCTESKYSMPAGGSIMSCTKPTPAPTPPPQCVQWNGDCDYDNKCCGGLQCMWANFDPPKTVCLTPTDQSGPPGQCVSWNEECNYDDKCCKGYNCTWANFDPPKTVCI